MSSLLSAFFKTTILPKLMTEGKFRVDKAFVYSMAGLYAMYGIMRANGWLPKKSVNGKHVFITGAGSGIGKEMAKMFAAKGAIVYIINNKII